MFWSGNYTVTKELSSLLKEENVKLTQVLEADDILQECKADNKPLIQFLTRPDILAELISLITEEPPKDVELTSQYRHASIACEVLTSHLSTLSERLAGNAALMNKLCDFLDRDPPLNPLLASYYSKTIEMLLERSPAQDWCLYQIVCLQVLDLFKSRRDFLPNLLRHISTSAIADIFKYFIRLENFFHNYVMEWLEEHKFLDCLIDIICGNHVLEPDTDVDTTLDVIVDHSATPHASDTKSEDAKLTNSSNHDQSSGDQRETEDRETNGKTNAEEEDGLHENHTGDDSRKGDKASDEDWSVRLSARSRRRLRDAEAANAAALLTDIVLTGCAGDAYSSWSQTAVWLRGAWGGKCGALLSAMFTCRGAARARALRHGADLLRHMLHDQHAGPAGGAGREHVESSLAPHLPLIHQELLVEPAASAQLPGGVGAARLALCRLLAALVSSPLPEVCSTLLTLGTPRVVLELMYRYPENNFLHAELARLVRGAAAAPARARYLRHFIFECDLLTKLMDAFEENDRKKAARARRAGYAGHVVAMSAALQHALGDDELEQLAVPAALADRWRRYTHHQLAPVLAMHNEMAGWPEYYESGAVSATYDVGEVAATYDLAAQAPGPGTDLDDGNERADSPRRRGAARQMFDKLWESEGEGGEATPDPDLLGAAPWDNAGDDSWTMDDNNWAQFNDGIGNPIDPFANLDQRPDQFGRDAFATSNDALPESNETFAKSNDFGTSEGECEGGGSGGAEEDEFTPFWSYSGNAVEGGGESTTDVEGSLRGLRLGGSAAAAGLTHRLLAAMSAMAPADVARIVRGAAHAQPRPGTHTQPADQRTHNDQTLPQEENDTVQLNHRTHNDQTLPQEGTDAAESRIEVDDKLQNCENGNMTDVKNIVEESSAIDASDVEVRNESEARNIMEGAETSER